MSSKTLDHLPNPKQIFILALDWKLLRIVIELKAQDTYEIFTYVISWSMCCSF